MFQSLKETYEDNKVTSITTSLTALAGLLYAVKKQKGFGGIVGYTIVGAFAGMLLSTAINKIS